MFLYNLFVLEMKKLKPRKSDVPELVTPVDARTPACPVL